MSRFALQAALLVLAVFTDAVFAQKDAPRGAPVDVAKYTETIRVACVGDSITAGVGVKNGKLDPYPTQLDNMLGEKWTVKNFGVSGSTMLNKGDKPYQKEKAFKAALESKPDVVIIMLGTNDTKPQNWKFQEEFAADAKSLISQFAELPTKPRIFIALPVPAPGAGNFGINDAGVKAEQPLITAVAKETGATVIDLYSPLVEKPEHFPDRVHPNTAGASVMAATVYQALAGKAFVGDVPPPAKAAK